MLRKLYWAARSTFASPPPPKPEYFSRFGGLWTDRRDALTELDRRAAADPTVAALRDKLATLTEDVRAEGWAWVEAVPHLAYEERQAFQNAPRHRREPTTREARRIAEEGHHPLIIVDGPPGIGCPVIASIRPSLIQSVIQSNRLPIGY